MSARKPDPMLTACDRMTVADKAHHHACDELYKAEAKSAGGRTYHAAPDGPRKWRRLHQHGLGAAQRKSIAKSRS